MLTPSLKDEMSRLERQAQSEREAAERATVHPRDMYEPMDVRLAKKLAGIPADVQRNGLSMEYLCSLVKGQRGRGSYVHVAQALRRLGWYRLRNWSRSADGFRAYWYPPQAATTPSSVKESNDE
jgi:hypothetical protein